MDPPPPPPSRTRVALTVLFHSSCAIWSTLLSKSALNGVSAPVTLLAVQTVVQVLLMTTVGSLTGWIKLSRPLSAWIALLPLTLARLTGILAKTYCLASVDASVYQIARGLLLPFTLLLSLAVLRPRPYFPPLSLVGCGLIMAGFVVGMGSDYSKMLTSGNGILLGIGSSLTTAAESVVVKKLLTTSKEGMWQMIWMSNTMAILFYVPLLPLSGELGATRDMATHDASGGAHQFFSGAVLTGLSSFLLTIATFMQIEVTSPTTHMVITAVRGIAQSSLAIIILGEVFNSGRAGSILLILAGSALYGWARDRYAQRGKAAAATAAEYVPLPDQEREQRDGAEGGGERPKAEV